MAPNPRVTSAFKAMKAIGISETKVKPVLKKLLKLYEKNWELIEAENYRVLADAIFDEEDEAKCSGQKKPQIDEENFEEEDQEEQPLLPLKRLRRGQEQRVPPSPSSSRPSLDGSSLKRPKVEGDELPATSSQNRSRDNVHFPQVGAGNGRTEIQQRGSKGKELVSAHVASTENRGIPKRSSQALSIREPAAEPGNLLLPMKVSSTQALIKPKDEPFTDDMYIDNRLQYEVPIAVIHPDSINKGDSSSGNVSLERVAQGLPASPHLDGNNRVDGVQASSSERRSSCELVAIPEENPSCLEIASSPKGEEKLGTVTPCDSLRKSTAQDVLLDGRGKGNIYMSSGILRESVDNQCFADVVPPQVPRHLQVLNGRDKLVGTTEEMVANGSTISDEGNLESSGSHSLILVPQCQLTSDELRAINNLRDVTKGEEKVQIPWINEINTEHLPPFYYIAQNLVYQSASVNISLSQIGAEQCCSDCFGNCLAPTSAIACACATARQAGKFVYTPDGLLDEAFLAECVSITRDPQQHSRLHCRDCPLERSENEGVLKSCKGHLERKIIRECWSKCGCCKQCGNRVVQRGINSKLQVFYTAEGSSMGRWVGVV